MKPKYWPSSAAFATGFLVHTTYNSGCLRKIWLAQAGIREALRKQITDLGASNEDAHAAALEQKGLKFQREVTVKTEDGPVAFSGRVDYLLDDDVQELKSTSSKSKRTALRAGRLPIENVGQLVAYMLELGRTKGRLIFTYYQDGKPPETYEFPVEILEGGAILVNSRSFPFNVYDHLHHRALVADLHAHRDCRHPGFSRPVGHDRTFDSPCHFCPFKQACDALDKEQVNTLEEFESAARKCV